MTVSLKESANSPFIFTLVETGANTGVFAITFQAGTLSTLIVNTLTVTYAQAKKASVVAENVTGSVTLKKK